MRSNTSLLGRVLFWIALRLDILTKIFRIIFNENLFPCSPCDPWMFLVAYGKKSLGEILFKMLLRKKYFREIAILNRFLDRLGP